MKLSRACDLMVGIMWFPAMIVGGMLGGISMGYVAWWGKVSLTWRMRNSSYAWEECVIAAAEKTIDIERAENARWVKEKIDELAKKTQEDLDKLKDSWKIAVDNLKAEDAGAVNIDKKKDDAGYIVNPTNKEMDYMVGNAQPGDVVKVRYSGKGCQIKETNV